jgi:proton-dependent oligopeptide transporter, POT family
MMTPTQPPPSNFAPPPAPTAADSGAQNESAKPLDSGGQQKQKHPKGLYVLFFTEMWERFSFYLMIGILYQYLVDSQTGGMGWSGPRAASIVGSYIGLVYFTPFLGGLLADRLLGCRITIIMGGVMMAIGHVLLAFPTTTMLYLALLALVIGNGLFKPNISTLVGNLYPQGSPLKDAGYNIFYMGINIGAFTCNFVAAIVRNLYGWHWAFATAGIGMVLGVIVFIAFQRLIRHADRNPRESTEPRESLNPLWFGCLAPAVALGALGWWLGGGDKGGVIGLGQPTTAFIFACIPVVGFYLWVWRSLKDVHERARVSGLLTIFGVVVVFWMVFHQNSTALTDWAVHNTDRTANAFVKPVIALAPEFAENAPPEYFKNAGPTTPRPDKSIYQVVPDAVYQELLAKKQLAVEDGKAVPVTQKMYDEIFAHADASTPALPPGKQLKLVNAELFQSINPGFVILFTPLVVGVWSMLRRRKKEPSTSAKIGIGLVFTSLSAVVMVAAVYALSEGENKASAWWLFGTYSVITVGELCLSPMGLSLVSKMSPLRIRSFMMGGWFLSTAIGNKLSGVFGEKYHEWHHDHFFMINSACVGLAGLAIFALLPWLKRQMSEEPTA